MQVLLVFHTEAGAYHHPWITSRQQDNTQESYYITKSKVNQGKTIRATAHNAGMCTSETADVEGAQRPNSHHMRSNDAFTAPAPSTAEAIQTLSMAKARLASTVWWPKTSIAAAWITPFTTAPRILTGEGLRCSLWGTGCRACAICP